jgi:hypothetical protein
VAAVAALDVAQARALRDAGGLLTNQALRAIADDDLRIKREADAVRIEKRREEEAPAALTEATIAAENYARAQADHVAACEAIIETSEKLNAMRRTYEVWTRKLRGLRVPSEDWPTAPKKIELSSEGRALLRDAKNCVEVNG